MRDAGYNSLSCCKYPDFVKSRQVAHCYGHSDLITNGRVSDDGDTFCLIFLHRNSWDRRQKEEGVVPVEVTYQTDS